MLFNPRCQLRWMLRPANQKRVFQSYLVWKKNTIFAPISKPASSKPMLQQKIEHYFQRFPALRVLFFFDPAGERREEVEQLGLAGIRVVRWEQNDFYLKTRFYGEWAEERVFLYLPREAPKEREGYLAFPLLGLLAANKALALDDVGEFMDEFQLPPQYKALVSKYMRELQHASVREVCAPLLKKGDFQEPDLVKGLLAAFLRFSAPVPWSLLLARMLALALPAQEEERQRFQKKVEENQLLGALEQKTADYFGERLRDLSRDSLLGLLRRAWYNQIVQTLPVKEEDPYRALRMDRATLAYFNQFLQEVEGKRQLKEKLDEALELVQGDIQSRKLIAVYGPDASFARYPEDMLWALIALELPNLKDNPAGSIERLENLSLQEGLLRVLSEALQFLIQAARLFERLQGIASYILDTPDHYLDAYVNDWMQVDLAYRKAVRLFRHGELDEARAQLPLDGLMQSLNAAYEQHLDAMNREWLKCLSLYGFEYQSIHAPKQYDFYQREVAPYDQKVVVIISDGLRYEAAAELLSALHSDPKNTADIRYQLASIPSKTNIGMAQLLPGQELAFVEGSPAIEGLKAEGIASRRQILARQHPDATAEQFSALKGKSQEELRELFKHKLVYVYHDVIDARGDKSASEDRTFLAVEETIEELRRFVKSLHATYNVARVLITADHGFLYNDRPIEEKDKERSPNGKVLQNHSRFELSAEGQPVEMGYKFPLSATTKFREGVFVTIPESVNRYKLQGVGYQYVHGGGSLQELVVPIIESSRKRQEVARKVKPMLLKREPLRVVSSILRAQILQAEKVSRFEKEITISVGLYKGLELVSNEQEFRLNSTDEAPSERLHRVELALAPRAAQESFLKLKVFDIEDKLNPLIEELVQNSTLIQTDF
jgi:hypothetical protein